MVLTTLIVLISTQCLYFEAHLGHKAIVNMKIFDTKKETLKLINKNLKLSYSEVS